MRVAITLQNGTVLHPDAIRSIHFAGHGMVTIKGWKTGLNQTEDQFRLEDLTRIDFDEDES